MRIGIQLGVHGHSGEKVLPAPGWSNMRRQVEAAEAAGFDLVVIEDALVDGGLNTHGYWEGMTLAGAVAAVTSRIDIGHSVINPPLRFPAGGGPSGEHARRDLRWPLRPRDRGRQHAAGLRGVWHRSGSPILAGG